MKVALGADHRGYDFKERIKALLARMGIETIDFGTNDSTTSVDYPNFGLKVAHAVADHKVDFGINVCWTGNGMNIAANKVKGVRSGLALSPEMAQLTRAHNNANVLALSGKYTPSDQVEEIVKTFLETKFEGGRHERRIEEFEKEEDPSKH
ncbi:MAG: ribose 5-phosphate isomerase B [Candidatus Zixiibacteriota bacterium]